MGERERDKAGENETENERSKREGGEREEMWEEYIFKKIKNLSFSNFLKFK
jgi:hypothetical protein